MSGTSTSRAINSALKREGLRQIDIAPIVGGRNRASEICAGKRAVPRKSIVPLSRFLNIPIEKLLDEARHGKQ